MRTRTSKLWLHNTSIHADEEAFILCRVALESVEKGLLPGEVLHPIKVNLTNTYKSYCGRAWWQETAHGRTWRRVLVRIGKASMFPRKSTYPRYRDMPEMEFRSHREAIVGVVAHEVGHTLGYSGQKDGEERCEMMVVDALDYYRAHQEAVDQEILHALKRVQQRQEAQAQAGTPEQRLCAKMLTAKLKVAEWQRKAKLAATKVKNWQRVYKRKERELMRASWKAANAAKFPDATPEQLVEVDARVDQRFDAIERLAAKGEA